MIVANTSSAPAPRATLFPCQLSRPARCSRISLFSPSCPPPLSRATREEFNFTQAGEHLRDACADFAGLFGVPPPTLREELPHVTRPTRARDAPTLEDEAEFTLTHGVEPWIDTAFVPHERHGRPIKPPGFPEIDRLIEMGIRRPEKQEALRRCDRLNRQTFEIGQPDRWIVAASAAAITVPRAGVLELPLVVPGRISIDDVELLARKWGERTRGLARPEERARDRLRFSPRHRGIFHAMPPRSSRGT